MVSSVQPDVASVVLDIDVFKQGSTRVGRRNMERVEALRLRKNLNL